MTDVYHLRGKIFPFDDEIADLWVVNGHLTFEEPSGGSTELSADPLFLIPGFVDAHTHLTMPKEGRKVDVDREYLRRQMDKYLEAGVLMLRDIGQVRHINHEVMNHDHPVNLQSAGKFLFPEGGYIGGVEHTHPEKVLDEVRMQVNLGYNWIKIVGDWFKVDQEEKMSVIANYGSEIIFDIVKEAHNLGVKVAVHAVNEEAIRMSIEAGVDTLEHGNAMTRDLLEVMADKKIAWTPTLIANELFKGNIPHYIKAGWRNIDQNVILASQFGIDILAGTDITPFGQVYREVEMLRKYGLSLEDSLAAATTTPRKLLGGSLIEEGAPANLVGFDSNPMDDLGVIKSPKIIIGKGKLY